MGLSVCWVEGRLRFWDRERQGYLPNQREQAIELVEAEARIRELEEELRRRENPYPARTLNDINPMTFARCSCSHWGVSSCLIQDSDGELASG